MHEMNVFQEQIPDKKISHVNRRRFKRRAWILSWFCRVDVTFITPDGTKHKTKGKLGDNLLDVVVNNNVDLDGFGKDTICNF